MTPTYRQKVGRHLETSVSTKPMFHRVFAAEPTTVRKTLVDIRARFGNGQDEDTMGRLELVLAEVLNNVAEHAVDMRQGTSIHLCIVRQDAGFACAVTDDGVSLPQECLQPRNLPQDGAPELPEGGFGWYLIQDLTQALCYYRERHRNFLAFSVPFQGAEPAC